MTDAAREETRSERENAPSDREGVSCRFGNSSKEANMPVAMMVENPNVTKELYDKVREHLGMEGPAGGIFHAAGEGPNGWRVIELWESEEDAFRFLKERLKPAWEAVGVTGPPPQPQFWQVHNVMK
jgi:hypothetical protein